MAAAGEKVDSVRISRFEGKRLAVALALSLLVHFLGWGGYEIGKRTGLWQHLHWPKWLQQVAKVKPPRQPTAQMAQPEIFLDVSQPSTEAPKTAKYYAAKNSRAANPDAEKDSTDPKLNGKQTDVPKTQTTPASKATKAQSPPPTPESKPSPQETQPKPAELAGNTKAAQARPAVDPNQLHPARPRTLSEARAQLSQSSQSRPDLMMRQEGGVPRHALVPSLDALSTSFGAYDAKFVDAVTSRWRGLLDSQQFSQDRTGKVTLRFRLNYDGTITDMQQLENTVGDLLGYVCQKAIMDPAPYEQWPEDMRREIGKNYRDITFTFYYY